MAARVARDELGFTVVGLGTYSREFARDVREAAALYGCEALITDDYLDVEAKVDFVKKYPNVFLSHTFSKAFGLAGVRFGYVVAHPTLVDAFNLMYLPWNLSLMAIAAAEAILDTGEVKDKVVYNNKWMATFVKELEAKGLKQMRDASALEAIVDAVIAGNARSVDEYRAGKDKAFNALVGQVMKASKGKANPAQASDLLKRKLG